jgi:hypothetical protein
MERVTGLADPENHVATGKAFEVTAVCNAFAFGLRQVAEERKYREVPGHIKMF